MSWMNLLWELLHFDFRALAKRPTAKG
jgi:hypothetical protein